ncbi:MAG: class I SAM-dependent methyltransferase [Planctomycetota bacterium]|jgi:SAM-dependent methyltransferase
MPFFVNLVGQLHQKLVKPRQSNCIVDYLVRFLPHRGKVLDVGCGTGKIARMVREKIPNLQIKGIDILVQSNAEIEVEKFDGNSIPFEDNYFDAVMFVDVLHHTINHRQLLLEASRVCTGPIVIKDHLSNSVFDHKVLSFMDWVGNRSLEIESIYNYYSDSQWNSLFNELGIRDVTKIQVKKLYPFPCGFIFNRNMQVLYVLWPQGNPRQPD